jgi:hypothetical protein
MAPSLPQDAAGGAAGDAGVEEDLFIQEALDLFRGSELTEDGAFRSIEPQ